VPLKPRQPPLLLAQAFPILHGTREHGSRNTDHAAPRLPVHNFRNPANLLSQLFSEIHPLNILVTAPRAYIGGICSEVLLAAVTASLLSTIFRRATAPPSRPKAVFCLADLGRSHANRWQSFLSTSPNAVMHFAGEAWSAKSVREPSTFTQQHRCGVNLLDAMIRHN